MEVTDRKLRILYVITKANWGGAQRYVFDLAKGAHEAGHTVLVVSGAQGELLERLADAGIEVASLGSLARDIRIAAEFSTLRDLIHVISRFKPDIIHGNSSKAGGLAAVAGRVYGVKQMVFTAHGWAFNEDRPKWQKALIALAHGATVLLCDRTICVSEALARDMAWLPFGQSKLSVIPNGIDSIDFFDRGEARASLAPELPASTWIGSIAELHPTKQLHVLISAFARIASEHPDTGLVLMGEGEERSRLEKLIAHYELTDRIILCGHVSEASRYLSALDIFVLPSRSEGLGYVLLEAGLASLPVVASNVGGIPEIVRHEENGLLVPSGDEQTLTSALTLLIENAVLRENLGAALRERVVRVFPSSRMIRETLALYYS